MGNIKTCARSAIMYLPPGGWFYDQGSAHVTWESQWGIMLRKCLITRSELNATSLSWWFSQEVQTSYLSDKIYSSFQMLLLLITLCTSLWYKSFNRALLVFALHNCVSLNYNVCKPLMWCLLIYMIWCVCDKEAFVRHLFAHSGCGQQTCVLTLCWR